jgi:hypothetical protein
MMFGREFSTPDVIVPENQPESQEDGWIEKATKALGIAWDTALTRTRREHEKRSDNTDNG